MKFRNVEAVEVSFSVIPVAEGGTRAMMTVRYADGVSERFVREDVQQDWART
ncbi:hypothetical protein [Sabulicella rubraurantiaca]|uniref:hypothetical protein n=1 Tax=Sabulicella rubraurantiaca TaxID=2811429 RepID=UPI001A9713FF|nr:hypothetical protein [Sabulicella rubraurantiaca]